MIIRLGLCMGARGSLVFQGFHEYLYGYIEHHNGCIRVLLGCWRLSQGLLEVVFIGVVCSCLRF